MKIYILSDIHYDFYRNSYLGDNTFYRQHCNMDRFFEREFLPADTIVIPGDLANTFEETKMFIKDISSRYKNIVMCLGNHDLALTWDTKIVSDNPSAPKDCIISSDNLFKTSEEKIDVIKKYCNQFENVHLLDGNCISIDGVKFGGSMGIWDMSFIRDYGLDNKYIEMKEWWRNCWFDGIHWDYCSQNLEKIRELEFGKVQKVLEEHPDVMLTHFAPLPSEKFMHPIHRRDYTSAMFYFDDKIAKEYLAENPKAIWCAGHTHTAFIEDRIYVHPKAYPEEHPRVYNKLHNKNFLLNI